MVEQDAALADSSDPVDGTPDDASQQDGDSSSDGATEDTSVTDAVTDVVAEDSSPDADSAVEDAPDEDADAGPQMTFCEQLAHDWGYTYCRDFDDGQPILFGWDSRTTDPNTTLLLDPVEFYSTPNSFLARVESSAAECSNVHTESIIQGDFNQVDVAFRLRLGASDQDAGASVNPQYAGRYFAVRLLSANGATCDLAFHAESSNGKVIEESGESHDHPLELVFPLQQEWTHVRLTADRTAGTFQVKINSVEAFASPRALQAACGGSGGVAITPGIACADSSPGAQEVRIDNIVVNAGNQ